jgi:Fe-S cluster assembly protein SufD
MGEQNLDTKKWYIEKFAEFQNKLNGEKDSFLNQSRLKAFDKFKDIPFPSKKDEEWKYTNISPILKQNFTPISIVDSSTYSLKTENYLLSGFESDYLVFIDGKFSSDLSKISTLPEKTFIGSLQSAFAVMPDLIEKYFNSISRKENAFSSLNNSFVKDGFVIIVPDNTIIQNPIQVIFITGVATQNVVVNPHNLFVIGKNSNAKVVLHYLGNDRNQYFTNSVNEVILESDSVFELIKIQDENKKSFHIDNTMIIQDSKSVLNHFSFDFGSKLSRTDLSCSLLGEHSECNLSGLYIVNENRHTDNHTFVDHAVPNCLSNELYKGILDDDATGVFSGKILVRKDSQKTQAYQSNKNVLLSESANVDTKPQLEIFADDVKCSHGATVGSLDKNGEYYLRTRGVPKSLAQSILIHAFAVDVLDSLKIEVLKEHLNDHIFEQLHRKYI